MRYLTVLICLSFSFTGFAQSKSRFSLEAQYGPQANFFVVGYDETSFFIGRTISKKRLIGSIGGLEMSYRIGRRGALGIGYARSVNSKSINYNTVGGGVALSIRDFRISHTNQFYQFYYERGNRQRSGLLYHAGLFYMRSNQQEIDAFVPRNAVSFDERNFKNSGLEEGGVFVGLHYRKKIDTHFDLGLKSRLYFLLSTSSFESVTLTPTLTYRF